ncbi:olfactory receptor 2F1-like [Pleurodeles waltl]|uniref:olfactory receptor 2F1-like n=1 Tax=Pleurodeles waltl TaxID=8319 RepID=UPI003709B97E
MTQSNFTMGTGFILHGFSDLPSLLQFALIILFLVTYILTMLGNSIIFVIITVDHTLHTPMYYFLKNLSVVEIAFTTVTVPKMVTAFLTKDRSISFVGCAAQMCFFLSFGATECLLLAVMALDRYMAICVPLHYMTIMRKSKCVQLALTTWIMGTVFSICQTSFIFQLNFCKSRYIYHFFCDVPALLRLPCVDTSANEIFNTAASVVLLLLPLLLILLSYIIIFTKISKLKSAQGRRKAISTCASHITSVSLFYGACILSYMQPSSNYGRGKERVFAAFYAFITPMLNPLIYSLRNEEVKTALRKRVFNKT